MTSKSGSTRMNSGALLALFSTFLHSWASKWIGKRKTAGEIQEKADADAGLESETTGQGTYIEFAPSIPDSFLEDGLFCFVLGSENI